ncbi:LysR substrate-binding domain-containing protein, partial [Burkholderia cenocepacia]|uniref:LysR substrate-binding domain-containing protein n=1 Tax=Burkholderia cenocepacia TaxID=95486 RepID=UPI0024B863AD
GSRFAPDSTQRVFRLHMSDFAASAFLPTLLAAFDRRAPGAVIETLHVDECQLHVPLESGRIDFALGHFADASSHFQRTALLHERCVLLAFVDVQCLDHGARRAPVERGERVPADAARRELAHVQAEHALRAVGREARAFVEPVLQVRERLVDRDREPLRTRGR